jgi:hypothetical protein
MAVEQLEQKLESYKRGLMFFAGIALTLLALAVTTGPQRLSQFWNWYLLWAITQVAVTPIGFVFLVSKDWRQLPLSERLDTAFGHLAVAWLLLLSFLVKSNRDGSVVYGGDATLMLYALVAGAAMALAFSYWRLRAGRGHSPEEMFP